MRSSIQITRPVLFLSFASLFTDIASEAVFPLLPVFLTSVLGATPLSLGLIEGIADSVASLLKLFSGIWSDRMGKCKPIVLLGYGTSNLIKPLIAFIVSWPQALVVRFFDRVGKGIRSAPRDAWLAKGVKKSELTFVYGFHRSMDHAGAVLGPLLATLYLWIRPNDYRGLFAFTFIPGLIAVLCIQFAREPENEAPKVPAKSWNPLPWNSLPKDLRKFFVAVTLFSLANGSDAFILLRFKETGLPTHFIPLAWAALHVLKMVSSYYSYWFTERLSNVGSIRMGWIIFSFCYLAFGATQSPYSMAALLIPYAFFFGLTEGPERAFVASHATNETRGSAFGYYAMLIGITTLPASVLFGALWKFYGSKLAFQVSSAISLAALFLLDKQKDPV